MAFSPFDPNPIQTHTITGTVPQGANVVLYVDGKAVSPTWEGTTLTYDAPAADKSIAALTDNWTFTVAAADMTPLSQTGTLQVRALGDNSEDANVAVFDTGTGKLVSQGRVTRARVHFAEDLPAGTYDVVAWQANDFFKSVASIADFAAMGFDESDYAKTQATLAARETTEIDLTVPALDTAKVTGVLASGGVSVPSSRITPGVTFYAQIRYEMAGNHTASALKLHIPEGMTPVAAYSPAKSYGVAGWNAGERILTIGGLTTDDAKAATISVGLRVDVAATYAINAMVTSGTATVPVGSARLEPSSMELVVPQGALSSATFTAHVYAAPNTQVKFAIGSTELETTCTTNKAGHGTAELTIPATDRNAYHHYRVTATTTGDSPQSVSDTVEFSPLSVPTEPKVQQFYFETAGNRNYLVKDGEEIVGGGYLAVMAPSAHPEFAYSPTWPFTVVVDSLQPLEDTLVLRMGMVDQSVRDDIEMALQSQENLENGAVRYTYTYDLAVGDGDRTHIIPNSDFPSSFDIYPQPAEGDMVTPKFTQADVDALKQSCAKSFDQWKAEAQEKLTSDQYATSKSVLERFWPSQETDQFIGNPADLGVFNKAFHHEKWDPEGTTWASLTGEQRTKATEAEEGIAVLYNYLAWYMGDKKPLYEYGSLQEYLADNYGFATGQANDPAQLEAQGYFVIRDGDTNSVPNSGTADANGNVFSFTRPVDRWANGGLSTQEVKDDQDFGQEADENSFWNNIGTQLSYLSESVQDLGGNLAKGIGKGLGVISFAYDAWQCKDGVKTWGDYNSMVKEREAELWRLKAMEEYYRKNHSNSPCLRALQTEIEIITPYIKDLKKHRLVSAFDWPVNTVLTGVGGYAFAASVVPGAQEVALVGAGSFLASAGWSRITSQAYQKLAPDADFHQANLKRYRAYRERTCRTDTFGKMHYKKPPKIDPSDYVFEGVEGERVEGVTATIYQKVGDEWQEWTEASEYDEVNPQTTNTAGLFAWNVPEGDWKVLFTKEGYDNVWSDEMHVAPEHTNVAINMLRSAAPAVTEHKTDEGLTYVDVTFDQSMKTGAAPTVTVDGAAVTGATWQDAVSGRDETGQEAQLSRTLRVPLPTGLKAGRTVTVALSDGKSYAGKPLGNTSFEITVPGEVKTTFTLTFDLNGGTLDDKTGTVTRVLEKGAVINMPAPTRNGYTFSYWKSPQYKPGDRYTVTEDHTFTAVWEKKSSDTPKPAPTRRFPDVPEGSWYYGVVYRAAELGLINGYGDGRFGPNDSITRGQVAVILWNMTGNPAANSGAKVFPDVAANKYYYAAVRWASSVGVVSGYKNGKFGPEDLVTREQLAAMLANYAARVAKKDTSGSASDYRSMKDAAKVSDWAVSSVGWCFRSGIISGTKDGRVNPQGTAARAEAAKMIVYLHDLL